MCFQLDRIKNIGSLPCLEKLNLSGNPMCIIPDYRTKVLAQFGDRAAEVLLGGVQVDLNGPGSGGHVFSVSAGSRSVWTAR